MQPINLDLNFFQGDDFSYNLQLTNPDGTFINVAGYVFASQAKISYYTSNVAASLLVNIIDAPNGNIAVSYDSANTSNLAAGNYVYDVTMKTTSNVVSHIMSGLMLVSPGVTNITPPNGGLTAPN